MSVLLGSVGSESLAVVLWVVVKIRVPIRLPLRGYYKGTIRVPLNKGLEFPKIGCTLFGGPYSKDPTI